MYALIIKHFALWGILDKLKELIAETIANWITSLANDLNDTFSSQITNLGSDLTQDPKSFSAATFSLIKQIHEDAIIPIAGIILTFVFCYELIQLGIAKNNKQEIDSYDFFIVIAKTTAAIFFIRYSMDIVMAFFDVARWITARTSAISSVSLTSPADGFNQLAEQYKANLEIGSLMSLLFAVGIGMLISMVIGILAQFIVISRMIEIYIMSTASALTMGTMFNHQFTHMGQSYLKNMFALALQGVFMIISIAIYMALISRFSGNASSPWTMLLQFALGGLVLISMLFKSGTIAKTAIGIA